MSTALANHKVLVLNRDYRAINVVPLHKAMSMIAKMEKPLVCRQTQRVLRPAEPKARIYDPRTDFTTYTWEDWMKLKANKVFACQNAKCEDFNIKLHWSTTEIQCAKCKCMVEEVDEDSIAYCPRINGVTELRKVRLPSIILLSRYDKSYQHKNNFNRRAIYKRDRNTCQYCGKVFSTSELNIDHVVPRGQGGLTTWENVALSCVKCNTKKGCRTPKEANMKLLSKPEKPKMGMFTVDHKYIPKDWTDFLSECYWLTTLENDNPA